MVMVAGVQRENITLCDSRGVVYAGRSEGMNEYKAPFAQETEKRTLAEALVDADVFIGLSVANVVSQEMVQSMADTPIIFAMANPDPEITYQDAKAARPDIIIATGRTDYPNQINNVLGFPFIFRGALDVRACQINEAMKLAAAKALAALAQEDVPDSVLKAYNQESLKYGPDYIIPKPFDPRVLLWVAPAVAQAAMESGVARQPVDLEQYGEQLEARLGKGWALMRTIISKAQSKPKRIVFGEGEEPKIIRAAAAIQEEGIGRPILLGHKKVIQQTIAELGLDFKPKIIHPDKHKKYEKYCQALFEQRQRCGVTLFQARSLLRRQVYYGPMMVQMGDADAYVAGFGHSYPDVLRPALELIGTVPGVKKVTSMYIMIANDKVYFFADPTVVIEPTAEDLAQIACMAADEAKRFNIEPRIAMLSFSNFGSVHHPDAEKVRQAVQLVRECRPDLEVDGEMMADTAVTPDMLENNFPFSQVRDPNVLIFPNLAAANVAYKLLHRLGGAEAIGPVLMGMNKPVHLLQTGNEVRDIINIAALAVVDAQAN